MKKILFAFSFILILMSCSSDDQPQSQPQQGVNQSNIYGYWYKGLGAPNYYYDYYYFGQNGEFKQGWGNINTNPLLGTWVWLNSTTIKMTPTPNGGIAGGVVNVEFRKVTSDSLCGTGAYSSIKYSRINHGN